MEVSNKPRKLFVVQSDNINGEGAGAALEALYKAGAKNVQIISTITKKNRPGYLFVVDGDERSTAAIQEVILHELQVTGWHELPSNHCYVSVTEEEKDVRITVGEKQFTERIARKLSSADPEIIRPEYESCRRIQELLLKECGQSVSLALISQKLVQAFDSRDVIPEIVIKLV